MRIKKYILLLAILLITLSLFGCSANKSSVSSDVAGNSEVQSMGGTGQVTTPAVAPSMPPTDSKADGVNYGVTSDSSANTPTKESVSTPNTNEKLVKNIQVSMETKEYEKTVASLQSSVINIGGYIQTSNVPKNPNKEKYSGLKANFSFMVPTSKVEEFLVSTNKLGSVTNTNRTVQNVTNTYLDAETHIRNLELKEKRLLELLGKAGSLKDLLEIENNVSNTRYEIERYKATIKDYDKRIAYTELSVQVNEVYTYTPKTEKQTLSQRISSEFNNGFEDFKSGMSNLSVWIVGVLPFIIIKLGIFAIPCFLIFLVIKKIIKKVDKNKAAPKQTKTEEDKD